MEDDNKDAPYPSDNPFILLKNKNINDEFFKNDEKNIINNLAEEINNLNINNKKRLIPRDYQKEVFEKSKEQNSIIYMETGKGKTLIAIMLMADLLGIDIYNNNEKSKVDKNKKIIFLVGDTALVDQQKKEISSILNIEVDTIQGKKDSKSKKDKDFFKIKWNSSNIFVAIPDVLYNLLSHGFIKIFDISMLIFDECHHAKDNHPYNKIMEEFYFYYKKEERIDQFKYPRIYGLTASPLKNSIKGDSLQVLANDGLQKLCQNLDCSIVIDPEMINSYAKEMKPGETIDQYLNDDIYVEVECHTNVKEYKNIFNILYDECFVNLLVVAFSSIKNKHPEYSEDIYQKNYIKYIKEKYKAINIEEYNKITQNYNNLYNLRNYSPFFLIFEKLQRHIFMILENLCLDSLILYFGKLINIYTKLHQRKIEEEEKNGFQKSLIQKSFENEESEDDEEDILSLYSDSINELLVIYKNIYQKLKDIQKTENYISDRLTKLYTKIKELFNINNNSKFIIFIKNRIVAHFLQPVLSSYLEEEIKNKECKEIIGINKKKSEGGTLLTPTLTLNKMNEIITQFNEDKFDILIGTSVIEEGLNIQSCNAVISLVELNSPKSFIQIKGRARKSNSHFYIFTNDKLKEKAKIKDFISIGKIINDFFKDDIVRDFRKDNYIEQKEKINALFNDETHSKITLENAPKIFNEFKQQIISKRINFVIKENCKPVKSNKKVPEYEYIGEIDVETDLNDIKKEFPYQTKRKNTKKEAKSSYQLYFLYILEKLKYLDNNLKIIRNKFLER